MKLLTPSTHAPEINGFSQELIQARNRYINLLTVSFYEIVVTLLVYGLKYDTLIAFKNERKTNR